MVAPRYGDPWLWWSLVSHQTYQAYTQHWPALLTNRVATSEEKFKDTIELLVCQPTCRHLISGLHPV